MDLQDKNNNKGEDVLDDFDDAGSSLLYRVALTDHFTGLSHRLPHLGVHLDMKTSTTIFNTGGADVQVLQNLFLTNVYPHLTLTFDPGRFYRRGDLPRPEGGHHAPAPLRLLVPRREGLPRPFRPHLALIPGHDAEPHALLLPRIA